MDPKQKALMRPPQIVEVAYLNGNFVLVAMPIVSKAPKPQEQAGFGEGEVMEENTIGKPKTKLKNKLYLTSSMS